MKIFENLQDKVNFVDENNVFVGYSLWTQCCERAGWFVADQIFDNNDASYDKILTRTPIVEKILELPGYVFDKTYFTEIQGSGWDCSLAVFRLVNGEQEKFLHIFNAHNGYYSHGFEFQDGDTVIKEGNL